MKIKHLILIAATFVIGACAGNKAKGDGVNLSAEEVQQAMWQQKDLQLIDVRSDGEWDSGRIARAKHIPVAQLQNRLNELDKTKPVITYCAAGGRSATAMNILNKNGFTNVSHLANGISGWRKAGFDVEK